MMQNTEHTAAPLLVRGGRVHDAVHPEPQQIDLLLENGRIVAMGHELNVPADIAVLDAAGLDIFPGFVDAHTHIGLDGYGIGYEGCDYNEMNDIWTPQLRAIDGINPRDPSFAHAREAGITCVCTGPGSANVLGGTFTAIKTVGERVDNMIVKEAVAMKCAFGENPKRVYNGKNQTPSTRMATAALMRKALIEAQEYNEKLEYINSVAIERSYAKDIRMFGLANWIEELYVKTLGLYRAFAVRQGRVQIWGNVIDIALTFLRNGAAYAYLIWYTLEHGLGAAQFLLYFGAVSGFAQWVTGILDKFGTLHRQSLDISELRDYLEWEEPFDLEGGERIEKRSDMPCEIRLENVRYRYIGAEKDTIRGLDLTIHAGEKLAIVGLNGAGKTTLVKLICGFLDPTEGRVLFNGKDVKTLNRRDYYALFSAVFQQFSLLDTNIIENIAQRIDGIDGQRAWDCAEKAGLTEKIKSLPKGMYTHFGRSVYEDGAELSGGETQRLMLARALYKDGPIIALDEPTAALDPIAENDIYQKYSSMTQGRTSLFISHRLASTRFCDRIIMLKDGCISEEGTHDELMRRGGEYAKLFAVQSKYYREGGREYESENRE